MSADSDSPLPERELTEADRLDLMRLRLRIAAQQRAIVDRENRRLRQTLRALVDAIDEDDDCVHEFNHALGAAREALIASDERTADV